MVVTLLAEALGKDIQVPPHPQEIGAFGAALAARDATLSESVSSESAEERGSRQAGSVERSDARE